MYILISANLYMCWTNPDVEMILNHVFSFECQPKLSYYRSYMYVIITVPWTGGYWMLVGGKRVPYLVQRKTSNKKRLPYLFKMQKHIKSSTNRPYHPNLGLSH